MINNFSTFKNIILLKENLQLNPLRWIELNVNDIVDFIDEILYNNNKVNITEKIAGQHLTIIIEKGWVYVQNKEQSLDNIEKVSANKTRFGKPISDAFIQLSKIEKLADATYRFELVHPRHNHDYIKYKNTDIIAIEYTGTLSKVLTDKLNKFTKNSKILCHEDIKLKFNNSPAILAFKDIWESNLRNKILNLRAGNKYYEKQIKLLKDTIADLIEKTFLSVIDNKTPIEGIVASVNNKMFKLQTPTFLKLQSYQMTFYSLVKCKYDELQAIKANPNKSIVDLRIETGLPFKSIYKVNENLSLIDVLKHVLEENSKIGDSDINTDDYNRWMTKGESDNLLKKLNQGVDPGLIYDEIVKLIK